MGRCFAICALFLLASAGVFAEGMYTCALGGGVPSATWQDSDRQYRNKQGLPLDASQRAPQAAKVRTQLGKNNTYNKGPVLQMQAADGWRIRIREAAVTQSNMVTLGDIADPLGDVPAQEWERLRAQQLWAAPEEAGKPFQVNKNRLRQALREVLGDVAERCIVPGSIAIQRGGLVLYEHDLRNYVVSFLTPQMAALPGQADISEFRLPPYIFLAHPQQRIGLETGKIAPGRISVRFAVQDADGSVLRRVAGVIFMDMWFDAPAAARPLLKGEMLQAADVTFIRTNAAQLKGMPWDGRGGPWQMARTVAAGETIFQSDLENQAAIRKGNIISLLYQKGNLSLAVQAESLADGEVGATIPVRNLQSKKHVYAIVRDSKTVIVQ